MKYICSLLVFIVMTGSVFGQENLELKLLEVFSTEKVSSIMKNNQKRFYYNNVLFNSFELKEYPYNKLTNCPFTVLKGVEVTSKKDKNIRLLSVNSIIESINEGSFNILLTNLNRDFSKRLYFLLENTNKVLIVYPYKEISNKND